MNARVDSETRKIADARIGRVLIGAAVGCLVAVGGVLWWRQGGAVFNDMILAGLAWCF